MLRITDLAIRWNYTRQDVHQKIKSDPDFPKPIAIINANKMMLMWLQ